MRKAKSLIGDEDGAELVEFAIASTILFMLIFGIIQFSIMIYSSNFVALAAQQGTRYAMVRGSDWSANCASTTSSGCQATTANVQNYILGLPHPGLNLQTSNISVTWLTTTAAGNTCTRYSRGCQVEVEVSYPFPLSIPFFSANFPLSSTSIETIQD